MFQPVDIKVSFPRLEEGILKFWQQNRVFEKSIKRREGGPRFVFYEGPPTANGRPGIHHVLARSFKDLIPRYWTMKGYYVPRSAGWDTHGLPVELEVERELGFTTKADIEKFGITEFNARCRENVFKYLKEWNALTERIAFWLDLEHPYITMDNAYIESCWWALKEMWDKGLIYQGYRVTPHCPRCGTSLSSHEVALGYREDAIDPALFVKFKIDISSLADSPVAETLKRLFSQGRPAYLLAWTTTPWTLPGNTALAISPDADYAIVEIDNEYLILALERLEPVGLKDAPVRAVIKGNKLAGLTYEPLYNPIDYGVTLSKFNESGMVEVLSPGAVSESRLRYPVIAVNYVSLEEGTGIVHTAPAYGEDDYDSGVRYRLYFIHPVDLQGKVTGAYPFSGKFVKAADPLIISNLKERGALLKAEKIQHAYPFCWRCDTPLLYYGKQSWYIRTTARKERLISGNDEINWYPDYIKYGRFGDWLEHNVDWAFSRERYWGTPLPIWRCENCNYFECVGSLKELAGKPNFTGFKEPLDLHRPDVDALAFDCPKCQGKMRRVPEVIDCWFDSGAMPFAQHHHPFEHQSEFFKGLYPADFICEAVDQTRGWFYSLHAAGILLFDRPAYKNVICLGHILDAKGEKMSKSRGNVVDPWSIITKYGADALRWYCYTSAPPGNARRFSDELVADVVRRFMLTLWNTYSFFVIYANIDRFTPKAKPEIKPGSELDRWVISELNVLIADVDTALQTYNPTVAGRRIESFVDDLSNWYVRRSRRRFWKSENDVDKLAAYDTLYECLTTLIKLLAPFMPFLAEDIYQNLVYPVFPDAPESVHLTDFPEVVKTRIDRELNNITRISMKISSLGRAARAQAGIRVRQPLAVSYVKLPPSVGEEEVLKMSQPILEELNVKELRFARTSEELMRPEYSAICEGDYGVAVPKKIPPELLEEGMAREIVHRLQIMRRSAGFLIADHIVTFYQGDGYIQKVMVGFAGYISQETLSKELKDGAPLEGAYTESFNLDGHNIALGVKKLTAG